MQTETEIDLLGVEKITRIRNQPGKRVHNEIRVQMSRPWARDHVASKGKLLSEYVDQDNRPMAGIRMDVLDFLSGDFKTLDRYGLRMKNIHRRGTKRYIKYDEPNMGLILELRMPGDLTWLKITPAMAREFVDASDKEEIDRNRRKLTSRRTRPPRRPTTRRSTPSAASDPTNSRLDTNHQIRIHLPASPSISTPPPSPLPNTSKADRTEVDTSDRSLPGSRQPRDRHGYQEGDRPLPRLPRWQLGTIIMK